ncbi:hypothetical protein ACP275_08G223000 [Erythranthe tilingii]
MKALIITYTFLLIGFLLLMHIDPTVSKPNKNPRFNRMLKGKQPSPPPPTSSKIFNQRSPPMAKLPRRCPPPPAY